MAKKEKTWQQAIKIVLEKSKQSMHYTDIAEEIIRRGLRTSLGATPANSVSAALAMSINSEGEKISLCSSGTRFFYSEEKH